MHSLTCVVLFSLCIPTPLPSFSSCTHECWEWWGKSGTGHIWIGLWSRPRQWVAHDAESYLRFVQSSIYFSIQSKVTYNQESVNFLCAAICRLYHEGLIVAITKVWSLANMQPLGLTASMNSIRRLNLNSKCYDLSALWMSRILFMILFSNGIYQEVVYFSELPYK